jgi:predicted lipoprotein with Yx(FWY)xxD motif
VTVPVKHPTYPFLAAALLGIGLLASGAQAFAAESVPPGSGIVAQDRPLGTVFLTAAGMPLYVYDPDKRSGKSTCNDKCATAWPPFAAADDAQPMGAWTVTTREEGGKQWVFEGNPLYTYAKDSLPGLATGEGAQDIWHRAIKLAPRPRDVTYRGTAAGRVAADLKGMTLYTADKDTGDGSGCTGACLQQWLPMHAPGAAIAVGDWTIVERKDDGEPQWAYKGKPVYRFAADTIPGGTAGEGLEGKWHALVMDPAAPSPKWLTVQQSEVGPIFATAKGQTLYTLTAELDNVRKLTCDDDCLKANFVSALAEGETEAQNVPGSNWGVLKNKDGQMQWTFRGKFIYLFNGDTTPGDIKATAFGGNGLGATWTPIPVSSGLLPVL